MHAPVRVVAPASQPVSLAEAKAQLRIDDESEDALIAGLIAAAVEHFDGWTGELGRALAEQQWRQDFDAFATVLRLPLVPVISVDTVTYTDPDGETQTVASDSYTVVADALGAYVRFVTGWSAPSLATVTPAVSITYTAGYADMIPESIRLAILMLVGHWYANREAVAGRTMHEVPFAIEALTTRYRNRLLA